jgi:hypothetical protein
MSDVLCHEFIISSQYCFRHTHVDGQMSNLSLASCLRGVERGGCSGGSGGRKRIFLRGSTENSRNGTMMESNQRGIVAMLQKKFVINRKQT